MPASPLLPKSLPRRLATDRYRFQDGNTEDTEARKTRKKSSGCEIRGHGPDARIDALAVSVCSVLPCLPWSRLESFQRQSEAERAWRTAPLFVSCTNATTLIFSRFQSAFG